VVNKTEVMTGQQPTSATPSATPSNVIVGEATLAWGRKINVEIIVMKAQPALLEVIRAL